MKTEMLSTLQMSRNRFLQLRNNLNIVDVTSTNDESDRLWKVRPLIDAYQSRCRELDIEERVCIDEQNIPFKGNLSIKQYMKGKPNHWGIKVFLLCESSGIVYESVYQGSATPLLSEAKAKFEVTRAMVLHLAVRIPTNAGYKLYFDNYFTSVIVI